MRSDLLLTQDTFQKFGYRPSDLLLGSSKKVIHKCEICNKLKETPYRLFVLERSLSHNGCSRVKYRQTCIERYGVDSTNKMLIVKQKKEQTTLRHYGVKSPGCAPMIQEKMRRTCLRRYGKHPRQVKEIQDKAKQTLLRKYGVENPSQSFEIQKKIRQTWLRKRGVESCIEDIDTNIIKHIRAQLKQEGYVLLSNFYVNSSTKLEIQCPRQHRYQICWGNFEFGYRCSMCNNFKQEKKLGEVLEQIFPGRVHQQDSLGFLGRLRVDYSIPSLKLAFEYDGKQHFEPVCYGGIGIKQANERLKVQQKRDRCKNNLCERNQYQLIRIRYNEPLTAENIKTRLVEIKK
jgi:very-short-patch-repair endonuclease